MTDKQIIDKINVKECKYYCNGKCERYEEFVEADYADYSVKCICEKENDLFTYDICDYQQLKRKEQEHKETQKALAKCWIENGRLKKECEELKEQLTILDDEDVVVEITVKQFEEYKKLKQTLAEIKEIAEACQYGDCHECKYQQRTDCRTELIVQILQKISESEVK